MNKKLKKKIKSEGLPGGPNERIYSSMGYLPDSPDRNNPYNIIPSNQITMEGVPFPILGIDDLGNQQMMYPGMNYTFPGNEVFELPIKQTGGGIDKNLLLRQQFKESSFNPNAKSPAGAVGLAQIMPSVKQDAIKAGIISKNDDIKDPHVNQKIQDWYMKDLYNSSFINKPNQDDSVRMAKSLAAYNWGRENFRNYLNEQKAKGVDIYNSYDWVKNLPTETSDYINKILLQKDDKFEKEYKTSLQKFPYKQEGGSLPQFQSEGEVESTAQGRRDARLKREYDKLTDKYKQVVDQDFNRDYDWLYNRVSGLNKQMFRDDNPSQDVSRPQTDSVLQSLQYQGILNENTPYAPVLGMSSVKVPVDEESNPGDTGLRYAHSTNSKMNLTIPKVNFEYGEDGSIKKIKGVKEKILGYEPIEGSNFQYAKISDKRLPQGYKTMVVPLSKEHEEEFNSWSDTYNKTTMDKKGYVYPHYEDKKDYSPIIETLNKKQYGGNMDNIYKKTDMINSQNPFEERKNNFMDFLKSNSEMAQIKEFETLQKEYDKFMMKCGGTIKKMQQGGSANPFMTAQGAVEQPLTDSSGYMIQQPRIPTPQQAITPQYDKYGYLIQQPQQPQINPYAGSPVENNIRASFQTGGPLERKPLQQIPTDYSNLNSMNISPQEMMKIKLQASGNMPSDLVESNIYSQYMNVDKQPFNKGKWSTDPEKSTTLPVRGLKYNYDETGRPTGIGGFREESHGDKFVDTNMKFDNAQYEPIEGTNLQIINIPSESGGMKQVVAPISSEFEQEAQDYIKKHGNMKLYKEGKKGKSELYTLYKQDGGSLPEYQSKGEVPEIDPRTKFLLNYAKEKGFGFEQDSVPSWQGTKGQLTPIEKPRMKYDKDRDSSYYNVVKGGRETVRLENIEPIEGYDNILLGYTPDKRPYFTATDEEGLEIIKNLNNYMEPYSYGVDKPVMLGAYRIPGSPNPPVEQPQDARVVPSFRKKGGSLPKAQMGMGNIGNTFTPEFFQNFDYLNRMTNISDQDLASLEAKANQMREEDELVMDQQLFDQNMQEAGLGQDPNSYAYSIRTNRGENMLTGLRGANKLLGLKDERKKERELLSNFTGDNMFAITGPGMSGSRGDYGLNPQGSNFRLDETGQGSYGRFGNVAQFGKEIKDRFIDANLSSYQDGSEIRNELINNKYANDLSESFRNSITDSTITDVLNGLQPYWKQDVLNDSQSYWKQDLNNFKNFFENNTHIEKKLPYGISDENPSIFFENEINNLQPYEPYRRQDGGPIDYSTPIATVPTDFGNLTYEQLLAMQQQLEMMKQEGQRPMSQFVDKVVDKVKKPFVKRGTRATFQEGGEYDLSPEEVMEILKNGGSIEFLD